MPDQLTNILTLARAGSTSRAWHSFVAAGLDQVTDDSATLTLKGRLLKDQARQGSADAAACLYLQSAKAYADAAALRPDSYPLINAATMSLFAGQPDDAALLAEKVLAMLDANIGVGETPYWHEATRAEALMLLGRLPDTRASLDKAVVAAPAAWEDRAATLRQFRQIARFRSEPSDWLAEYAPPGSLYFKGMIGVASDDISAAELAHEAVYNSNAGFGYGALAAGADILIAEALVARGAELHLVLPVISSAFRAQSVAPFGDAWLPRFDRLFEQAASVTVVAAGEMLTNAAIGLAAQVAKGLAIENAGKLEGNATGLELNDRPSLTFDPAHEHFLPLVRSAPRDSMNLPDGAMSLMLVSDHIGRDPESWSLVADGFYVCRATSHAAVNAVLDELRRIAPDTRCAVGIAAHNSQAASADLQIAQLLRMAQCAAAGTVVGNGTTARAMLATLPAMRAEPLGELPDAEGAVEIYAIVPAT